MEASGLDGLLLTTGTNLLFLSGYPILEMTLARPFYLVVPRRGAPILLVHKYREMDASRTSWIDDVRPYDQLSIAPVRELTQVFKDLGLRGGRVGAELGFEQRLGIPVNELDRLRTELAPTRLEDAADILWGLRMIKSDDDIESLREACRITGESFDATFGSTRAGDRYPAIGRRMEAAMTASGGRGAWTLQTSGTGSYGSATGAPRDRPAEPGEMVWLDAGCSVDGFYSDFSRAGVVGRPTPGQIDAHRAIVELTWRGIGMIRPGVPVAEIASAVTDGVRAIGFPISADSSGLAGRVGHGLGYDITEPPHLSETDPSRLEAGMVVSVEPGVATDEGLFHVEENVLVTADGYEVLSTCSTALRSIRLA